MPSQDCNGALDKIKIQIMQEMWTNYIKDRRLYSYAMHLRSLLLLFMWGKFGKHESLMRYSYPFKLLLIYSLVNLALIALVLAQLNKLSTVLAFNLPASWF
jgi:hypothetical protein